MNCPICGKEARAHIYYCAKCAVYVHEKCWQRHVATAHKKKETSPLARRGRRGR